MSAADLQPCPFCGSAPMPYQGTAICAGSPEVPHAVFMLTSSAWNTRADLAKAEREATVRRALAEAEHLAYRRYAAGSAIRALAADAAAVARIAGDRA